MNHDVVWGKGAIKIISKGITPNEPLFPFICAPSGFVSCARRNLLFDVHSVCKRITEFKQTRRNVAFLYMILRITAEIFSAVHAWIKEV